MQEKNKDLIDKLDERIKSVENNLARNKNDKTNTTHKEYSNGIKTLFELVLGLLLYYLHMNKLENFISQTNANDYFSSRFWAVEHTILMFFAIIFGHLGLVYAKNLKNSAAKFKKNFIYFGLSFVLIMISLLMNIPNNA